MSFTIATAKDQALTYQPLLLATFLFGDDSVLRLSTLPLNASEGGIQYNGQDWFGRVSSHDIQALSAMDEHGIDRVPQVTLHLADADKWLWLNYEMASGRGFKGAAVQLDLIFYDLASGTFSTDVDTKFVGICEAPQADTETLTVSAQARANTQQTFLPPVRIQSRCPWIFPPDADSQAESVSPDSQFYECGYNPAGGQGTAGFTSCGYIQSDCQARGMYALGRFGGITFTPPQNWRSKSYLEGKTVEGTNSVNDAKWNESYPLLYGTTWVQPPIINVIGDGNSTRFEAVLCASQLSGSGTTDPGSIQKVIVNDTEVPFVAYSKDKTIFRWQWVNNGSRNGHPNTDAGYDGKGDPYGSLACIEVCVPSQVAQSSGIPKLEVLLTGPQIHKFYSVASVTVSGGVATVTLNGPNADIASNDPNYEITISGCSLTALNDTWKGLTNWTYGPPGTIQFHAAVADGTGTGGFVGCRIATDNPAWVLLDILTWSNFTFDDVDLQSFTDAAAVCDQQINFINQQGANVNTDSDGSAHKRFRCSLAVRDRTSAANVLRGVRMGFNAYLDWYAGRLRLAVKQTLGAQQPSQIPGSNYNTPVASVDGSGNAKNGYVAYSFGPGSIMRDSGGKSTLRITRTQNASTPNRVSFAFQDRDNQYQQDTLNEVESDDIARATCEYDSGLTVFGPNTFDQSMRIAATYLAEIHRGNAAGDTRGTIYLEWQTTFRAEHLRVGQICLFSEPQHGIVNQLVRITKISAGTNYEGMTITAAWHRDEWYTDSYGQTQTPGSSSLGRDVPNRAPYPWGPNAVFPVAGDPMFSVTEGLFSATPDYSETAADGSAIVSLDLKGAMPVNAFATLKPPSVVPQATVNASGGTLAGQTAYWIAICAKDSNGKLSAPSLVARADIPDTGTTFQSVVSTPTWDTSTAGYSVFAGTDPRRLTWQQDGTGSPATITLSVYNVSKWGLPDVVTQKLRAKVKHIMHSGVFGSEIYGAGAGTLTITGSGWTVNQWAGRVCSIVAKNDNSAVPVANFLVSSNTGDTLTVTPDPTSLGVEVGDALVMRSKPTISGNVLTDPLWDNPNSNSGNGLAPHAEKGNFYRIIAGTGRGQVSKIVDNDATSITVEGFGTPLDDTSIGIIEEPVWQTVSDSPAISNDDPTAQITLTPEISNYENQAILAGVFTVSAGGTESEESLSPMREAFLLGAPGTNTFKGAVYLGVNGTLAIGSNLAPLVTVYKDTTARAVRAVVKQAPSGADLTIKIKSGGSDWMTLVVAGGTTSVQATDSQLSSAGVLQALKDITLDITTAGTTFPGSDLSVLIFE